MASYDDINDRWTRIGTLVHEHGTDDDKLAWALCRGDAAEWKYQKIYQFDSDRLKYQIDTLVKLFNSDTIHAKFPDEVKAVMDTIDTLKRLQDENKISLRE